MKKYNSQRGFTLIEMIISLGIFTVVAIISIGALLKISDANRKSLTLKTSINNLNFALESMSREMRFGSEFECKSKPGNEGTCENKEWLLEFNSTDGTDCLLRYAYWYDGKNNGTQSIKKAQQTICGSNELGDEKNYFSIISPDTKITDSKIILTTAPWPKVFFWLKGEVGINNLEKTEFSLQTTVSQRQAQ